METAATAKLSNYRQAPRKVRLVADLIRGKGAQNAINLLSVLPKRAGEPMMKLVKSAVSNAQKDGHAIEDLFISTIAVNGGIVLKRSMPRARGRASQILKRTSHITLALAKKAPKKADAKTKKAEPAEATQ